MNAMKEVLLITLLFVGGGSFLEGKKAVDPEPMNISADVASQLDELGIEYSSVSVLNDNLRLRLTFTDIAVYLGTRPRYVEAYEAFIEAHYSLGQETKNRQYPGLVEAFQEDITKFALPPGIQRSIGLFNVQALSGWLDWEPPSMAASMPVSTPTSTPPERPTGMPKWKKALIATGASVGFGMLVMAAFFAGRKWPAARVVDLAFAKSTGKASGDITYSGGQGNRFGHRFIRPHLAPAQRFGRRVGIGASVVKPLPTFGELQEANGITGDDNSDGASTVAMIVSSDLDPESKAGQSGDSAQEDGSDDGDSIDSDESRERGAGEGGGHSRMRRSGQRAGRGATRKDMTPAASVMYDAVPELEVAALG